MAFIKEFKEFAMRGNVLDMAVGIVIGGAFGQIVTSLVNDLIMPPLGLLLGGVDFSDLKIVLQREEYSFDGSLMLSPEIAIGYGNFIQILINFVIIAFAIFLVIKAVNKISHKKEAKPEPAETPADIKLLTEIRDALRML
ncbi:MAG: large-conductance mechanosensitive channel protein MscL [Tannerella sp.]|jgi:large conductance mechanosensitive channel|nr:large-conductance mechanosensitive channel protein MscL [Tannerella sp.]